MRVVLLIDNLGSGGAQRQITTLAKALILKGFNVTLVYYGNSEHMLYMLKETNVSLAKVDYPNYKNSIVRFFSIQKMIWSVRPDVLISYLDMPNKLAGVYKFLNKNCYWIASERNVNFGGGYQTLWRRFLFKLANVVVPNSYTQEKWLLDYNVVPKEKLKVIWNGVSEEFFQLYNRPIEKKNFFSMGRLSYQKNPELLMAALNLLPSYVLNDEKFFWYGEEDPSALGSRQRLKEEVDNLALPLFFEPAIDDAKKVYIKHDCLILTSRFEGMPNVVLEAMASGVFVVATNIVDLPKIIGENERGILYKSECPVSLSKAIQLYLEMSEDEILKIKKAAYEYAKENFSTDILLRNYYNVINGNINE